MISIKKYLFLFFALTFSLNTYCCSCRETRIDFPLKAINYSLDSSNITSHEIDIIFEGILIDSKLIPDKDQQDLILNFEVTDVFKGECRDTITIYTNRDMSGCGFEGAIGKYVILSAELNDNGDFIAFRSDCWYGVSSHMEPKRYNDLRDFLISLKYGIDGNYIFNQKNHYWPILDSSTPVVPLMVYSILNNKINGKWLVYDKAGNMIESGTYENGTRIGKWTYLNRFSKNNGNLIYSTYDFGYRRY